MPAGKNSEISKLVDRRFDEAYDSTLTAEDLPHVRWGHINYANATFLTTKWSIWSYVTIMCTPRHLTNTYTDTQSAVPGRGHRQRPDTPVLHGRPCTLRLSVSASCSRRSSGATPSHGRPTSRPADRGK